MMKITLARTCSTDNKNHVSRQTLERNAMDFLTGEMDFDDALELVETATDEELIRMIWENQNC